MTTADLQQSSTFAGKFRLVRLLGKGAMGEVWLAVEEGPRNFKRQVAVKRLLATSDLSDYARESFVAEAQVIARLDHPNIVRLIELGETADDHSLYLVLDFVDGAALDRLIKRGGPLSPAAVALIGREVARALDAVHSMADEEGNNYGVVHRDVSPANILISRDGRVRLSDFGVARISGLGGEKTETGVFKGKLPYMPPEQAAGHAFDGRADCFSLGITLFEALLGGRLRRAETQGQLIAMIATEQAPRVRERIPDAPEHLAYALDYATVFQPEHRVRSAGELASLLDDALRAIDHRAEQAAVAELRERVTMAADHTAGGTRTPWSVALSGAHPAAPSGAHAALRQSGSGAHAMSGSHPAALSGSHPAAVSGSHRFGAPPAPPDPDVATSISGSGAHHISMVGRASPPSVPSGAFTAAGSMAGPLDTSPGVPARRHQGALVAVAASVGVVGLGLVLFLATRGSGGAVDAPTAGASSPADPAVTAAPAPTSVAPTGAPTSTAAPTASAEATAAPTATATASPAPPPGPRVQVPPRPRPGPPPAEPSSAAVDESAPGTLQVLVVPWGNVSVDGKSYGATPIAPVSLPPGTHTVVVTNAELGAQRSATVKINPGKSHAVKFDLKKVD
jgi:serine/threonine-protein kinase